MTSKEKIEFLKDSITYFYEKEGRSVNYISSALNLDRKYLTESIKEWGLVKADMKHLTPSNQKFMNNHKKEIIDMIDSDISLTDIAKKLNIGRDRLEKIFLPSDKELMYHWSLARKRKEAKTQQRVQDLKDKSSYNYDIEDLDGEEWKPILGYPKYLISNMGRVKSYSARYDSYYEIKPFINQKSGRYYLALSNEDGQSKTYSFARLVAHTFVDGFSEINNTVDHINGDVADNRASNLEWVSQSVNNKRSYDSGNRKKSIGYTKSGKFKKIRLDDKYEFKTIDALARFLDISETQVRRYIDGESKTEHKFEFIY